MQARLSAGGKPINRIKHADLWTVPRPLVGMIHLPPLPGSPHWRGQTNGMAPIRDHALQDLNALRNAGIDGVIVENYGDVPFYPGPVPVETVTAMASVVQDVVRAAGTSLRVGVNVLRNDAAAALAIAAATGCAFIRVNVHTGSMFTDQGWIDGAAHETLRLRARLEARVAIFADVAVKHALPPPGSDIVAMARDVWHRGLADALIVTGVATGATTDARRLVDVARAVPEAPVWIGSGVTAETAAALLELADGAIVGSALQQDGIAGRGVDPARAAALVAAAQPFRRSARANAAGD